MSAAKQAPASPQLLSWLVRMLDEIDYGVLLLGAAGQVLYTNQAARLKLDDSHPLLLQGEVLAARSDADTETLQAALAWARSGRRKLISLGLRGKRVVMSVVPLDGGHGAHGGPGVNGDETSPGSPGPEGATLLVMGKQSVCEPLTVQAYARSLALTPAETRVMMALCDGIGPTDLAQQQGVALSTIRSQITAIRTKTGTNSIREMVHQVALLPPLVGALRSRPRGDATAPGSRPDPARNLVAGQRSQAPENPSPCGGDALQLAPAVST